MSDDDFVSADAGAAGTTPIRVGELKKGGMVMIKGHACKIVDYSTAKTGKHGSAKAMYVGIDIFTGNKHEDTAPTGANTAAPVVERREWLLTDINDDDANDVGSIASLLDPEKGDTRDDLRIPDDKEYANMRAALLEDQKDVFVMVIEAVGKAKVLPEFVQKDRK
jgi:translation initiation factor 5A